MQLTISIKSAFAMPTDRPSVFVLPCNILPTKEVQLRLLDWLFNQLNRHDSEVLIDIINIPMPSMSVGDRITFTYFDIKTPATTIATWLVAMDGFETV